MYEILPLSRTPTHTITHIPHLNSFLFTPASQNGDEYAMEEDIPEQDLGGEEGGSSGSIGKSTKDQDTAKSAGSATKSTKSAGGKQVHV